MRCRANWKRWGVDVAFGWLKKLFRSRPDYWDLVGPYWKQVSIYDGGDVFLRDLGKLPTASQHLLASHWLQSEVLNGGFAQFCSNSTGVLAPEAREGFDAIGMPQTAALIDQYLAFWGEAYPRDRGERLDLWERLCAQRYDVNKHGEALGGDFDELDLPFSKLIKSENGGFKKAASAYATTRGAIQ